MTAENSHDLGPLPKEHEREKLLSECQKQLVSVVTSWAHDGVTAAEIYRLLSEEMYSMSRHLVMTERRLQRQAVGAANGPA